MKLSALEELVLGTLSFYEPMTFSNIILDFSSELLKDFPNFDKSDLEAILKELEKKKLIKKIILDRSPHKEFAWIRLYPKRSWWKRIFSL